MTPGISSAWRSTSSASNRRASSEASRSAACDPSEKSTAHPIRFQSAMARYLAPPGCGEAPGASTTTTR